MTPQILENIFNRRLENIYPSREKAIEMLLAGKPLSIYWGIDPTGPDIHLGHSVPLLFLKQLAQFGHKIILLIGDFTARIGDPTDKESARVALSKEQVKKNMSHYLHQVEKILPAHSFEVRYNSEWLEKMNLEDVIDLTSKATVQQMLQRDMFQKRLKDEKSIHIHEFLYPLLQGYDSVALQVDGEVGGNDQTFNMLMGRDLEKEILGKEKLVFATRLLVDAKSGKKMSKSEGGFIAVSDTPKDIFEKVSNTIPDEVIKTVFELCTEVDLDTVDWSKDAKDLKEDLAYELVKIYHGEAQAQDAKKNWRTEDEFSGAGLKLSELVSRLNTISMSAAKNLITDSSVTVNQEKNTDWNYEVSSGDIVRVGKKRPVKIV